MRRARTGGGSCSLLAEAIEQAGARGNLTFDAQMVAPCRAAGASASLTGDRDVDRFAGVLGLRPGK